MILVERTLIIIKPDGMQKKLAGEVISRFEKAGLKIVGMKMVNAKSSLLKKHYPDSMAMAITEKAQPKFTEKLDPNVYGMKILKHLRKFLRETPVIVAVLEGENAVAHIRKLCGATEPASAEHGTIRKAFSDDSYVKANEEKRPIKNIIHASGTPEEANTEISIWFKEKELFNY